MDGRSMKVEVKTVSGLEDLGLSLPGADLSFTLLAPGPCEGRTLTTTVAGLHVHSGVLRADLRARGRMAGEHVTLGMIIEATGQVRQWQHYAAAGDLCVFPPGQDQEGTYRGTVVYATIALTEAELRSAAAAWPCIDIERLLLLGNLYRAGPQVRVAALQKLRAALTMLESFGGSLSARAEELLRTELLEAFLAPLADAMAGPRVASLNLGGAEVVRRVEDYLLVANREFVDVATICGALNLPRRTLARAFRETLGVGPMTYLRLMRLSAARCALAAAGTGDSVTEIALAHGFHELGRFAQLYRRMFDETPSETLRRRMAELNAAA